MEKVIEDCDLAQLARARDDTPITPADVIVEALGGYRRPGMCRCPAHDDSNPSLHVSEANGKVLFHCFAGCSQDAVLGALRSRRLWPVPGALSRQEFTPRRSDVERRRSDVERREYALRILSDVAANRGREVAEALDTYFARRGIVKVPATAMFAVPFNTDPHLGARLVPEDSAMVFEVTGGLHIVGCHVTWLNADLTDKRKQEPTRQFYGPIGGGFIKLYAGELAPTAKLIIAEGVETACAAAQLAGGLPAIAALSASNLAKVTPPAAAEYIIGADNDIVGLRGARTLAYRLVGAGCAVRLAIPPRPGSDWNDYLLETK
jgi:putative DNA primase/helicase